MNKLTSVLSILSFVGVVFLFLLNNYSSPITNINEQVVVSDSLSNEVVSNSNVHLAIIDIDSLKLNYTFYIDRMTEIQSDQKRLVNKQKQYQKTLMLKEKALQQQVQTNMFKTQAAFDAATQKLQSEGLKMQEDLANLEQQILKKDALYQTELVSQVTSVVKEYAKENGINYVVLSGSTSGVLYVDDELDITNHVVLVLNNNYNTVLK